MMATTASGILDWAYAREVPCKFCVSATAEIASPIATARNFLINGLSGKMGISFQLHNIARQINPEPS